MKNRKNIVKITHKINGKKEKNCKNNSLLRKSMVY